ncbi:unnamed protein product, partial [Prorocentrum cordatum]
MKAPPKAAETATTPTEPPRLPAEAVSAHAPPSSGRLARLTARASRPCRDRALRAMDNQNGHLCRQFQAGHCRRGAECPLAHELPGDVSTASPALGPPSDNSSDCRSKCTWTWTSSSDSRSWADLSWTCGLPPPAPARRRALARASRRGTPARGPPPLAPARRGRMSTGSRRSWTAWPTSPSTSRGGREGPRSKKQWSVIIRGGRVEIR